MPVQDPRPEHGPRDDETVVSNPVLAGSHPDPSILRVGGDYYLATSTFEWFPGVRIHHSHDLARWTPLGGALDETRLLDLAGCPDSGGVWAPNLTYVDGRFHLVYSSVSTYTGGFTDAPNYVTTAPAIDGPWSDPVLLHSRGFDVSLFHDGEDSWLVNLVHDWRPGHGGSAGFEATPYDRRSRTLVGDPVRIDLAPGDGWIEGPNVYRRGDWYYLVTADGGTGYEHQVTVARARHLAGPYERDPRGPLVTAKHDPDWPLQKAGHASLVSTPDDEWYLACLVARPHGRHGPCILGRETALARVGWVDGWPVVDDPRPPLGLTVPARATGDPGSGGEVGGRAGVVPFLGPEWSTLRRPASPDWATMDGTALRIHGGRSPQSLVGPSLVARPVPAPTSSIDAAVAYLPRSFQHVAGITAYYNSRNWHLVYLTAEADGEAVLRVASSDRGVVTVHPDEVRLPGHDGGPVRLGADLDGARLTFRRHDGGGWQQIGSGLDATTLSDEHAVERDAAGQVRSMGFTGAFFGLWVWDLTGLGHPADFSDVSVSER